MLSQTASRTQKAKKTARKATAAQASDTTLPQIIDPGWSWDDKLPLAQAKQIGNTIYVSGQVAFNADGKLVGKGNIKAQTR